MKRALMAAALAVSCWPSTVGADERLRPSSVLWRADVMYPDASSKSYSLGSSEREVPMKTPRWRCFFGAVQVSPKSESVLTRCTDGDVATAALTTCPVVSDVDKDDEAMLLLTIGRNSGPHVFTVKCRTVARPPSPP